ncbi:MAG TPA: pallilysin-related adhesin [Rectinemataceae bacterium]|nr:pallilysin-related adhesin [Rectinemataceae bacterium]
MKRLIQTAFFLVSAIALGIAVYFFIHERSGAAQAARPVMTKQVVVAPQGSSTDERSQGSDRDIPVNHIAALPNEVILDVVSTLLVQNEGGEGDEQILIVRKTDRGDNRLTIVVAAYLPARKTWVRAWEGDTLATKLTTFTVQAKDLIGDHNLDIICTGMDDSNEQTIVVFRRLPGGSGMNFSPILSLAADSISIGEVERPEGYQLGQTNGDSIPIYAFNRNKASQNLLDQVKSSYAWDARKAMYVKTGDEAISGAQVEREAISKVLTGSEKDFETFLQGVWYESDKGPLDPGARLLVFDKAGGTITFYTTDTQEVFRWTDSHATRYGLYAGCQNEDVANLRRLMDIELTGADTISVRVFEDLRMKVDPQNAWDGGYKKLPADASETVARGSASAPTTDFKLEGPYRSADGSELLFAAPRYSLKRKDVTERGAFQLFRLGSDTVLELSVLKDNGLMGERRTYRASYTETHAGKTTVRRLLLEPARTSISGLEILEEDNLVYEQKAGS